MICANLQKIRQRIAEAAGRSGRSPEDIQLLAVSKKMTASRIMEAYGCGQMLFGENFLQEARAKIDQLDPAIRWHFIGHLQSNKAGQAAELFTMVETIDRIKIARALDKHAGRLAKPLEVLVQVNIGHEKNKSGITPQNGWQFMREIATLPHLRVRGLMAIPPWSADPEDTRPYFRNMKIMADGFRTEELFADNTNVILSMGMTNDYQVAIEEGATLVRIGTAIFGTRSQEQQ